MNLNRRPDDDLARANFQQTKPGIEPAVLIRRMVKRVPKEQAERIAAIVLATPNGSLLRVDSAQRGLTEYPRHGRSNTDDQLVAITAPRLRIAISQLATATTPLATKLRELFQTALDSHVVTEEEATDLTERMWTAVALSASPGRYSKPASDNFISCFNYAMGLDASSSMDPGLR